MSKVISRALAAALVFLGVPAEAQAPRMPLGLMGTIPIYWGEAQQFGDLIDAFGAHPAVFFLRDVQEGHYCRALIGIFIERRSDAIPMFFLKRIHPSSVL